MDAELTRSEVEELVASVRWHQRWTLAEGVETPGNYDPSALLRALDLSSLDLSGKRVLDIGAADGFFSFQCEALGAEVVAVDHKTPGLNGFLVAKQVLGSKVEYIQANVYDLRPAQLGSFDVVLFLGVLYHLRHPLLALDTIRALLHPGGRVAVESMICGQDLRAHRQNMRLLDRIALRVLKVPVARFLPGVRFTDDATNQWAPNLSGLAAMVEDAGFAAERAEIVERRGLVLARTADDPEQEWLREMDRGRRDVP